MAATLFSSGRREEAYEMALEGLSQGNPRGCYELGMLLYAEGDFISAVIWNEKCLNEAPDWPYGFLAMHSIAACYHKAGVPKMADFWARIVLERAPFFQPSQGFLL